MDRWTDWEYEPLCTKTLSLPLFPSFSGRPSHSLTSAPLPRPLPPALTPAYLGPLTLGVVPSVKLEQLSGIVGEGVHVDAVPQHDHNSVGITQRGMSMREGRMPVQD